MAELIYRHCVRCNHRYHNRVMDWNYMVKCPRCGSNCTEKIKVGPDNKGGGVARDAVPSNVVTGIKKFWVVFQPEAGKPTRFYDRRRDADKEALRLAQSVRCSKKFFVMEAVCYMVYDDVRTFEL